jgi:hypothetical protein
MRPTRSITKKELKQLTNLLGVSDIVDSTLRLQVGGDEGEQIGLEVTPPGLTSLAASKKLKDIGFKTFRHRNWWWTREKGTENWITKLFWRTIPKESLEGVYEICPAYTYPTLYHFLPREITVTDPHTKEMKKATKTLTYINELDSVVIVYPYGTAAEYYLDPIQARFISLPDAAAEALLWCVEKGHLNLIKE